MPLDPATTTPIFLSCLAGAGDTGISVPNFAAALSTGLAQYAAGGIQIATLDTGFIGSGIGTGFGLILPPATIVPAMLGAFASVGFSGIMAVPTATAIGTAFSQCLAVGIVNTIHAGVGAGTGFVLAQPNSAVSFVSFLSALSGAGLTGISAPQMAQALASGLDAALPSATGVVFIAGGAGLFASTGAGLGKIS